MDIISEIFDFDSIISKVHEIIHYRDKNISNKILLIIPGMKDSVKYMDEIYKRYEYESLISKTNSQFLFKKAYVRYKGTDYYIISDFYNDPEPKSEYQSVTVTQGFRSKLDDNNGVTMFPVTLDAIVRVEVFFKEYDENEFLKEERYLYED